jgi:hypothetical protein
MQRKVEVCGGRALGVHPKSSFLRAPKLKVLMEQNMMLKEKQFEISMTLIPSMILNPRLAIEMNQETENFETIGLMSVDMVQT